jgi:hypothetical protein
MIRGKCIQRAPRKQSCPLPLRSAIPCASSPIPSLLRLCPFLSPALNPHIIYLPPSPPVRRRWAAFRSPRGSETHLSSSGSPTSCSPSRCPLPPRPPLALSLLNPHTAWRSSSALLALRSLNTLLPLLPQTTAGAGLPNPYPPLIPMPPGSEATPPLLLLASSPSVLSSHPHRPRLGRSFPTPPSHHPPIPSEDASPPPAGQLTSGTPIPPHTDPGWGGAS